MRIGYFLSCEEFGPHDLLEQARLAKEAGFDRALDLRPLPPVERRAGPEPVRLVRDRGARRRCPRHARHDRRHLPDGPDPPRGHRPGGGDLLRPARGPVRARRRERRGAQRAHPRRRLARGRRAAGDARGVDRGHARRSGRAGSSATTGRTTRSRTRASTRCPRRRRRCSSPASGRSRSSSRRASATATAPSGPTRTPSRSTGAAAGPAWCRAGPRSASGRTPTRRARPRTGIWPNEALPGELAQILPQPAHFEQASELVTEEMIAESVACGPDVDRHAEEFQSLRGRRLRRALCRADRRPPGGVLRHAQDGAAAAIRLARAG